MNLSETKMRRYKLMEYDSQYYLVDMETSTKSYLLPYLVWMYPLKVYKISEKEYHHLVNIRQTKSTYLLGFLGMILGKVIYEVLKNSVLDNQLTFLFLIIGTIGFIFFRLVQSSQQFNKLNQHLKLTNQNQYLNLTGLSSNYRKQAIGRMVASCLMFIVLAYFTISFDSIVLIIYFLLLAVISYQNRYYLSPYTYQITIR